MTKPKPKSQVPATRQKQIIKRWNDFGDALEKHKVTPDFLVESVKKLLNAQKRVVTYLADGERGSEMIPDANAVKNGIELAMEMMGLRNAKGFEEPSTAVSENMMSVNAVVLVTSEKKGQGWTDASVCEWLGTEEGVLAVKKKIDSLINGGDVIDV